MRIYLLEVKRVLKSRRSIILLLIALLMSAVMAWLPVMYEDINQYDQNGNKVAELNGLDAIAYKKSLRSANDGEVTPEKLKEALTIYQSAVQPYGEDSIYSGEFPTEIYIKKVFPVEALLGRLPETFSDPKTGQGTSLMEISPDKLDGFYEQTVQHMKDIMQMEQKGHPSAQEQSLQKYAEVKMPFQFYPGYSRDAFDYIVLFIFLLVILCTAAATPTFSNEYQTGSDSILRCTKHGRSRLAIVKIMAALTIFTAAFIICISLHLLISNLAFGTECMKTSMQMLFSVISLPAFNLGQLQIALAIGGLLSLLATISFTLFLSAKFKDSISVILIAIVMCLLPIFTYSAGANWLTFILPSGGIGMQNSLLYQLTGFAYLHIGKISVWSPYVIMAAAIIEIPVFLFLAVRDYCKHQVA
ncbi:ABC transporter permease [Anaerocolumna cellulosilytica]|uniref:ABC transporter permease n=1 Tax=Anaerocolumna cellulosilytica TaxID=433286 RepID=A0A6S6R4Z1_9FIRM|nr:ABC transporter permease subunit [Anaerocolumna cellulosilytica]MBB5194907.1 ABC-type transport system involved in multi-copper enzyme maturation permease subunit [Anaerocolumna cellulosilytica]BCJ94128.1 ABC transporter permease [Anaerocolumna cellulosilytica]